MCLVRTQNTKCINTRRLSVRFLACDYYSSAGDAEGLEKQIVKEEVDDYTSANTGNFGLITDLSRSVVNLSIFAPFSNWPNSIHPLFWLIVLSLDASSKLQNHSPLNNWHGPSFTSPSLNGSSNNVHRRLASVTASIFIAKGPTSEACADWRKSRFYLLPGNSQ